MSVSSTDRIVEDLKRVIDDAELLLRETASLAGDRAVEVRERAAETVRAARERLGTLEQEVVDRARDAARETDHYVRHNPWQSVGIAAGIGLIIGVLISRR